MQTYLVKVKGVAEFAIKGVILSSVTEGVLVFKSSGGDLMAAIPTAEASYVVATSAADSGTSARKSLGQLAEEAK